MRDIKTPQAIAIAVLLGSLVDSAKGGYKFDDAKWSEYLMKNGLRRNLSKPAYKDRNKAKPTNHLIDHLVFVTARETREEVLKSFANHFKDVSPRDNDLFRIRNEAAEEAKSSRPLAQILKNLESDLKTINTYWRQHVKVDQDDEDIRPTNKPDSPTFRTVVERCREDFLKLAPTLDASSTDPISDRISSWHRDHARGRSCHWDLLKASVAFYHNHKSTFIWHIAGVELGEIKAMARGRGWYRVVVGEVHEAFKLDPRVVDGARRREMRDLMEGEEGGKLGDEEGDDDTETDFGGDGLSQVDWNDFGF